MSSFYVDLNRKLLRTEERRLGRPSSFEMAIWHLEASVSSLSARRDGLSEILAPHSLHSTIAIKRGTSRNGNIRQASAP